MHETNTPYAVVSRTQFLFYFSLRFCWLLWEFIVSWCGSYMIEMNQKTWIWNLYSYMPYVNVYMMISCDWIELVLSSLWPVWNSAMPHISIMTPIVYYGETSLVLRISMVFLFIRFACSHKQLNFLFDLHPTFI